MRHTDLRRLAKDRAADAAWVVMHPRHVIRMRWQGSRYRGWKRWVLGAKRLKAAAMLAVIGIVVFSPFFTGRSAAQSVGPNNPTATNTTWNSSTNVYASDGSYASAAITTGTTSSALNITGFGYTVPTGSTITGINVEVERYAPSNSKALIQDSNIQLVVGGTPTGTNSAVTGTTWPTTEAYASYGGISSLWGTTLAPSDVNASNFGVTITAKNVKSGAGATNTAYIDHVRMTVYYNPPPFTFNQASYRMFNNQDANSYGALNFAAKVDYNIGMSHDSVAVGDMNGDGKLDIVAADYSSSTVSVLLNNGSGTFAAKVDYATGSLPQGVAVGDLNGDGKLDIVAANSGGSTVSVLLNNTSGTFAPKVDYTTGGGPRGVALGDLNGDGKLDIVTASYGSGAVSILMNNGDGTFAAKVDYATGSSPDDVALGDLNGDGKLDIVAADYSANTVFDLANNGDGTFASKVSYAAGSTPYAVALGDLNGDGKLDIVATNQNSNNLNVFLNTTSPPIGVGTALAAQNTAATVPGDGQPFRLRMDIGVAGYDLSANGQSFKLQYALMSTSCDVSFTNTLIYNDVTDTSAVRYYDNPRATNSSALTANANDPSDGTNTTANGGVIPETYQEKGTTTFTNPTAIPAGKDGMWDFALTTSQTLSGQHYCMRVIESDGTKLNTYTTIPEIILPSPTYKQSSYRWYDNADMASKSGFSARTDYSNFLGNPQYTASADFNGDGKKDVAVTDNANAAVVVLLNATAANAATASFDTGTSFPTGNGTYDVAVADFNGDGKPDLVVTNGGYSGTGTTINSVSVLLNTTATNATTPTFGSAVNFATGTTPHDVGVGDMNGDGKPDIVTGNNGDGSISVLLNTTATNATTPSFSTKADFLILGGASAVERAIVADFNGDGKPDVAASTFDGYIALLLNTTTNGATTPTFSAQNTYQVGPSTSGQSLAAADFNGDGKPDLAFSFSNNTVTVVMNDGAGAMNMSSRVDYPMGDSSVSVNDIAVADYDGDGTLDLASSAANVVSTIYNTGTGAFSSYKNFSGGSAGTGITAADFNSDNRPDLIENHFTGTYSISVLMNTYQKMIGSPLAGTNKMINVTTLGKPFRLKLGAEMAGSGITTGGQTFKLQFGIRGSGSCSAIPSSSFTDVTTTSQIQWYNNVNLNSGDQSQFDITEPTDAGAPNQQQTYQESNTFSNATSGLYVGQQAVWDFSLMVPSGTRPIDACFRLVKGDGTAFSSYAVYPELQYGPSMALRELMRGGKWFDQTGKLQPYFLKKY